MKRVLSVFLAAAMAFCLMPVRIGAAGIGVSAKSAVVIDAKTKKVLFEKDAYTKRPMASTTKIMTVLLCLESGDLDVPFEVDSVAIHVEGSSMGLKEGDIVTKRALCYGMLLPSGNDAANAAAVRLAGSYEEFALLMNARAAQIGMTSSFFVTPSGLDGEGHGSTAYDMALLAAEAMKNSDFREICSSKTAKLSYGNPPYDRWLKNSNKLLGMYDGCIGVKTGFTDDAGRCLVSAAERDGITLICVTLNAPNDWEDHRKMLDLGFSAEKLTELSEAEIPDFLPVAGGEADTVGIRAADKAVAPLTSEDVGKITSRVTVAPFLYAPIKAGDTAGEVIYYLDGAEILRLPITASEDVNLIESEKSPGLFDRIKALFQ